MVPTNANPRRKTGKDARSIVVNHAGHPMHGAASTYHRTESDTDRLMPQANAENRDPRIEALHDFDGASRVDGSAGAGRDDDRIRGQALATRRVELVAADHAGGTTKPPKVAGQIVHERIVIV